MKAYKSLIMLCLVAVFGLMLSQCKKDTETVTNTVHDTTHVTDSVYLYIHDSASGKTISGTAMYPDYSGSQVAAKGGVVYLYVGGSKGGPIGASAVIDASGNYSLPYLLPGNYFLWASYNTDNS